MSNTDDGTVTRVDVEPGEQTTVTVGAGPEGLSLGEQLLWVANGDSDSVSRHRSRCGDTVLEPQIPVQNKPIGVFVGKDTVWVTNSFSGTVSRIDSSTAEVLGTTDFIAKNIRSVIEAFGFVWVTSAVDDGTVTRLDPDTGEIVGRPIPLGDRPKEMAVARGFLWVVNERSNNVMRIDPETAKVVGKPIRVGNTPVGIAAGARLALGDEQPQRQRHPHQPRQPALARAAGLAELSIQVEGGVDQREVGERLGEVPERLPGEADLLRVEPDVVRVGEHLLEREPRLVDASRARQRLDVPERADRERALLALQPVGDASTLYR